MCRHPDPNPRSLPWPVPRWSAPAPSANWGWSKINYRNWHITGLLTIGLLVAFLRGNHIGHVEDLWVIGFALLGAFLLVRDWWGRRRGWLR
jgi:hypothetical protein